MDKINKVKPEKKFATKPRNILYEAWSYCFTILIVFLLDFGF